MSPFPRGLSGTIAFQSDLAGPDNPQGRTRIAFKSNRGSGTYDVWVVDANGANPVRITDHPANDHDPFWMPDGQSLIFSSERDSRSDLYRVWLSGRRVERLTRNFVDRAIMPNVSPDGRSVAFAAQTLARLQFWEFQVHVLDLDTGRTRALDNTGGARAARSPRDLALLPRVVTRRSVACVVRQPAASRGRELGPGRHARRWFTAGPAADDGPGQRPLARLETVEWICSPFTVSVNR